MLLFAVTFYNSLYHSLSFTFTLGHSLYHLLSLDVPLVFTRYTTSLHSLSLVVPLIVTRCHLKNDHLKNNVSLKIHSSSHMCKNIQNSCIITACLEQKNMVLQQQHLRRVKTHFFFVFISYIVSVEGCIYVQFFFITVSNQTSKNRKYLLKTKSKLH